MKKFVFFIPAIIYAVFLGWVLIVGGDSIHPIAYAWFGIFVISGAVLSKGLFWGGFLGVLPAIYLIYTSTIGQHGFVFEITKELLVGAIILALYLLYSHVLFYKNRKIVKG
jgi:hypothetical protein